MRISASVVRNQEGAVQGVLGMFEDVTELRGSDGGASDDERAAEDVPAGMSSGGNGDQCRRDSGAVEPAAEQLYGWTEDEVLGRALPTISDSSREEMLTRLQAVLSGNEVMTYESVAVREMARHLLRRCGPSDSIAEKVSGRHSQLSTTLLSARETKRR